MTKRSLGELEKRWNAMGREGQGERDIKKMQVEIESLWKKADAMEWSVEKEKASEEVLRRAKDDGMRCTQVHV